MGEGSTTVLVVTDDPLIREEATYGFPSDVEVDHAMDAREAMDRMKSSVPSVVVVDIQTGSAGGFSLARDMSQSSRLRRVPICMLLERKQDEWLAREAGARLLRIKPIETGDLVAAILELASDEA